MNSACISSCVDDARVPVRATYVNLYKWPDSDAEFVKWLSSNVQKDGQQKCRSGGSPRVVDSISCRQMYLRSYTFSRKESMPEKTQKCFGRVKGKGVPRRSKDGGAGSKGDSGSNFNGCPRRDGKGDGGGGRKSSRRKRCRGMRRVKEISIAAFCAVFHRLLSCSSSVDVVDH